jgi:hypothetical protein
MSPSQSTRRSATQEYPKIVYNMKINYRVHKILSLVPIQSHMN